MLVLTNYLTHAVAAVGDQEEYVPTTVTMSVVPDAANVIRFSTATRFTVVRSVLMLLRYE